MTTRAMLPQWPNRWFLDCYYAIPNGPMVHAYLSEDITGDMLAMDLRDASDASSQQDGVSMMRVGKAPFYDAQIVAIGLSDCFMVASIRPTGMRLSLAMGDMRAWDAHYVASPL